jgi:cytochrome c-type biogenesis protein
MPEAPSVILVFIAGFWTIFTPCVLPILPAVLSGSVGNRFRPLAIVTGMSITFTLMGILINAVASFSFFAEYLRWFSIFFIISMGAILFDDDVNQSYVKISSSVVNSARERMSFLGNMASKAPSGGIAGGLFLGMSLGILWIPCVGPILGAVFAFIQVSTGGTDLAYATFLLVIYSIGVSLPMLIIAYSGKIVSGNVKWFVQRGHFFKKLSGLILILVGLMMLFGIDKMIQAVLLPYFTVYF